MADTTEAAVEKARLLEEARQAKLAKKQAKKNKSMEAASGASPPAVGTAALVVKAAFMRVFGVPGTATTASLRSFPGGTRFALTLSLPFLEFAALEKMAAERVEELQETISEIVRADRCVCVVRLNRAEAEAAYGDRIYHDAAPAPALTAEDINIVVLRGVGIFYTPATAADYVASTGTLGAVNLTPKLQCKGLKGKNEVTLTLELVAGGGGSDGSAGAGAEVERCTGPPTAADIQAIDQFLAQGRHSVAAAAEAAAEAALAAAATAAGDVADDVDVDADAAEDFVVDPWTVEGVVDYAKLIDRFGSQAIDEVSVVCLCVCVRACICVLGNERAN
jgi:hypothetical protein